ncbi:MAG: hypothetical protein OXC62_16630 [Aestuariivita sp.]|nr:hypothetical protein [Aestuariivita sp.]
MNNHTPEEIISASSKSDKRKLLEILEGELAQDEVIKNIRDQQKNID